jgi:hypothetical protein
MDELRAHVVGADRGTRETRDQCLHEGQTRDGLGISGEDPADGRTERRVDLVHSLRDASEKCSQARGRKPGFLELELLSKGDSQGSAESLRVVPLAEYEVNERGCFPIMGPLGHRAKEFPGKQQWIGDRSQ